MPQTATDIDPQIASELIEGWRSNPQVFCQTVLGTPHIWRMQDDFLSALPRAIKEHKPIFIGSGHSLGKDYIAAAAGLWFLHSYGPSIVILTAPTDRQVKKIMWGETMRHFNAMPEPLGGKVFADPYLEIQKENWYLIGFTTKETGSSKQAGGGKFQGFHNPNICVIVSEAQAVEDSIREQIDAVATSENVLLIFLGNPTRASGWFAKGLKEKEKGPGIPGGNIVFNFSCLENPNYRQRRTVIPGLASYEWVEDKRVRWGEDSPLWSGRVLGQIPRSSINSVFSQEVIDLMLSRRETVENANNAGVSVDVAGEGDDSNVIYGGKKGTVVEEDVKLSRPPSANALRALEICQSLKGNFIIVDADGMGQRDYAELSKLDLGGINLVKFHGSSKLPRGNGKQNGPLIGYEFENLRAKAWFNAVQRAKDGLATIPNDPELIEELLEVKYCENEKSGTIQIEDKRDIKDRIGRSPDKADAWVMLQWGFSQKYSRIGAKSEDGDYQGAPRISDETLMAEAPMAAFIE